jgi:hypothetical protein
MTDPGLTAPSGKSPVESPWIDGRPVLSGEYQMWTRRQPPPAFAHLRLVSLLVFSTKLQRRHNHETFSLRFVEQAEHPELIERFKVETTPTLMVVADKIVRGKLVAPRGCEEIQAFLAPWLR